MEACINGDHQISPIFWSIGNFYLCNSDEMRVHSENSG